MTRTTRLGFGCALALAMACRGGVGGPTTDETTPSPTTETTTKSPTTPADCTPQAVFERNACLGCHGEAALGGLDLRSDGLEDRLVGALASAQGCDGRLLIDPERPENSQLLKVLTPDTSGSCVIAMPPPPDTMPAADVACLEAWVDTFATEPTLLAFEPTPLQAALTRVKRLIVGLPPTDSEISTVEADPTAFEGLVRSWTNTVGFEDTTRATLRSLLQINDRVTNWNQIDGKNMAGVPSARFRAMHAESVLRTAWDLIDRDEPFTELFRTNRWAMSTSTLVLLRYSDQTEDEKAAIDGTNTLVPVAADEPFDWTDGPTSGMWNIPGMPVDCRPDLTLTARELLNLQWGQVDCKGQPDYRFELDAPLVPVVDDEDWRFIEFEWVDNETEIEEPPYWDLDAWRAHTGTVTTRLPRSGFMTTPAFLNNWETNPDNEFRVTTNQMLIVALGSTFSQGDPTEPVSTQGLDNRHAAPGSDCYGCHRHLDPMRGYFSKHFSDTWQVAPTEFDLYEPGELLPFPPSFAFGGQSNSGRDIDALGDALAEHPGVASAWTQKLCWIANGAPCNIDDPEFQRVATAFADSGHNYRELVVQLFSSPLVTGLDATQTQPEGLAVSPKRSDQWCATVEARGADSCENLEIREALALLPTLGFVRGKVDPVVPQRLSVFAIAGLEKSCQTLAAIEVGDATRPFPTGTRESTLRAMVEQLAGLAPTHARAEPLYQALDAHVTEVLTDSGDLDLAMQSAYVLACSSPDAAALGL